MCVATDNNSVRVDEMDKQKSATKISATNICILQWLWKGKAVNLCEEEQLCGVSRRYLEVLEQCVWFYYEV